MLEYINSYLDYLESLGLNHSTVIRHRTAASRFSEWLNGYRPGESLEHLKTLQDDDLKQFINHLEKEGLAPQTIKRIAHVIDRMFAHYKIAHINCLKYETKDRPQRDLTETDFVSLDEFQSLLSSIKKPHNTENSAARDFLIDRNAAIIVLIRYCGLTPSEITSITMNDINLAQGTLITTDCHRRLQITKEHCEYINKYLNTFERPVRPRYRSADPLFVAYNNKSQSYQVDYVYSKPKQLSIRGLQEMLKNEVKSAGLRPITATHLRNTAILDMLAEENEDDVVKMFAMKNKFSLHRYKKYLSIQ